jgi:hypothetical protein
MPPLTLPFKIAHGLEMKLEFLSLWCKYIVINANKQFTYIYNYLFIPLPQEDAKSHANWALGGCNKQYYFFGVDAP